MKHVLHPFPHHDLICLELSLALSILSPGRHLVVPRQTEWLSFRGSLPTSPLCPELEWKPLSALLV